VRVLPAPQILAQLSQFRTLSDFDNYLALILAKGEGQPIEVRCRAYALCVSCFLSFRRNWVLNRRPPAWLPFKLPALSLRRIIRR